MTTDQIRKNTYVITYQLIDAGISIMYKYTTDGTKGVPTKTLTYNPIESLVNLQSIGSINKYEINPLFIWWDSPKGSPFMGSWELFCAAFKLCQYEALTLVVRHEYEESLKNDMNLLEMDKALDALK